MEEVKRGEIYYADLSPGIGCEQEGVRPVLILQNDVGNQFSPTTIVAALTSVPKKIQLPTHVTVDTDFLDVGSTVLLEQIRTVDKNRLTVCIGNLDQATMEKIDDAAAVSLGLPLSLRRFLGVSDKYKRNRKATISIRVSDEEKDYIINKACLAGKTVTAYMVEAALKSERPNIQGVSPILKKLNRIQSMLQRIKVDDKSLQAAYMKDILALQNEIYSATYKLALKDT